MHRRASGGQTPHKTLHKRSLDLWAVLRVR